MTDLYNYDLPKILYHIRPNSVWKIVDKTLVWLDKKETKPSYDEIKEGFLFFEKKRILLLLQTQSSSLITEIMNENYNRHSELLLKTITNTITDVEEQEMVIISNHMSNIESIKTTRDVMSSYIHNSEDITLILEKEQEWVEFVKYIGER